MDGSHIDQSRRGFLKYIIAGGALSLPFLIFPKEFLAYGFQNDTLETNYFKVNLKDPIPSLAPLKIGVLGDIHYGIWLEEKLLQQAIDKLNHADLDIIFLVGDFIGIPSSFPGKYIPLIKNHSFDKVKRKHLSQAIFSALVPLLSKLKAKHRVFAVPGNHDNWAFSPDTNQPLFLPKCLEASGIELLNNSATILSLKNGAKLSICGVDDYLTGIPEIPDSYLTDKADYRILISHNPDYPAKISNINPNLFNIALSGHTHGGQVKLPLLGAVSYNIEHANYGEGLVKISHPSHQESYIFTTRGLGVVEVPIRVNCPPEVAILSY
jgi:hypothetical protein